MAKKSLIKFQILRKSFKVSSKRSIITIQLIFQSLRLEIMQNMTNKKKKKLKFNKNFKKSFKSGKITLKTQKSVMLMLGQEIKFKFLKYA